MDGRELSGQLEWQEHCWRAGRSVRGHAPFCTVLAVGGYMAEQQVLELNGHTSWTARARTVRAAGVAGARLARRPLGALPCAAVQHLFSCGQLHGRAPRLGVRWPLELGCAGEARRARFGQLDCHGWRTMLSVLCCVWLGNSFPENLIPNMRPATASRQDACMHLAVVKQRLLQSKGLCKPC